jgi:hypothetical protein
MGVRAHQRMFLAVILPLAITLLACGASGTVVGATSSPTAAPTATATMALAPSATVMQVSQSQYFANSKSGGTSAPCANGDPLINSDCGETVTVTCASGDVVLGGGFDLSDLPAFVSSSYPSSASAWTITAHDEGQDGGSHAFTVYAYAECLHGNFSPGVSLISATPSLPADGAFHEESMSCPAGSVVTGGGFRGSNNTDESIPAANGWTVDLRAPMGGSAAPMIFALCATQHLSAASHPTMTANPYVMTGTELIMPCPAGVLLTSGGVHTVIDYSTITGMTAEADGTVTKWAVHIRATGGAGGSGGTYTVTGVGVCVTVS